MAKSRSHKCEIEGHTPANCPRRAQSPNLKFQELAPGQSAEEGVLSGLITRRELDRQYDVPPKRLPKGGGRLRK